MVARTWRSATTRHGCPPLARRWHCCQVAATMWRRLWYSVLATERATGQGTDGDRDQPARECCAAGRPGGRRGDRLPRMRHGPPPARDARRHGRALHGLRGEDLHPLRAVGAAHAGALPRRPLSGAGRQRLPDHDHGAGGPEQRRHDPGQRQGALRRRHVAAGDRRGPGRRGPAAGQDRRHAGDPPAPAFRAAPALDGRGLSLGGAAAALGDDGGLSSGRDRGLREAPGSGDHPSRRGHLRLHRHHPPLGRGRRALRPARDLAPPRPAGGAGRPGGQARHRAARLRAMRSGGAGGCRPAARFRLPALRYGDPSTQAGQPQSHLGAGAHRGHPLHPGQPAAGADRDLLRPGRAQHHRRRRDRARARRHAARGDSGVFRQHPGARAQADGLGVPPGVHPARMVGAPGRPDTPLSDRRGHRALVDGRCVHDRDPGRPGRPGQPGDDHRWSGRHRLLRRRHRHDIRIDVVRSAAHVGRSK